MHVTGRDLSKPRIHKKLESRVITKGKREARIEPEMEEEITAIAESTGCELVHAEFVKNTLRVFIDRPEGGVTLDDCQSISRQISAFLDVEDYGNGRYLLEVSSPGLDRKLYRPLDYERFCGNLVRVTYLGGEPRSKQTIVGRLTEFEPESGGQIRVDISETGKEIRIPLPDIQVARLEIEL